MRALAVLVPAVLALVACSSESTTSSPADPTPTPAASPEDDRAREETPGGDEGDSDAPARPDPGVEPEAFVPAGRVGSADAYDELLRELELELPDDVRDDVPWPDTRNPDPVQAQLAIFELWIWMAENHPEPALAQIMSVEASPGREDITAVFGELKAADELHVREQAPYVAFDHRVVTFETAGLPLWLARDVPDDAVVVYYQDQSGPTTIRDRTSDDLIGVLGPVSARQWLSIMVPTDVGWLIYRDQLIEPGDPELDVPDPSPPSAGPERRTPEV